MINTNRSRASCLFRISWSPCRLSCPFLRATKVAIQNSIEAPAITNLILNSWLIRLGSLLVSRPGPTPPTLRCTHAMLYESLFISLVSWLSSIVVSLVSDLDDYLPILFNSFDLLYTIQYLIQLFFLSLTVVSKQRPWSGCREQPQLPFIRLLRSPHVFGQLAGVGISYGAAPQGSAADVIALPSCFNEQHWLQFCPNFCLLAISAHTHMSPFFPTLF